MTVGALGSIVAEGVKVRRPDQLVRGIDVAAIWAWLKDQLAAQEAHLFLYAPFFLLFGDWIYFGMNDEPPLVLALVLGVAGLAGLLLRGKSILVFLIGLLLVGFATAKLREVEVATPMIRGSTNGVEITGYIANTSSRAHGARMLDVAIEQVSGVPAGEEPARVRVYAPEPGGLQVGDKITFKAYLSPLPRPVTPGGYDYARGLFFSSIGAGGRVIGTPTLLAADVPWQFEYRRQFRALRQEISDRITTVIPGSLGHLGDSMVSGERFGISPEMNTSLQVSGLAHIISISGVHMTIVGGVTFWALRAFLALFPILALRYPIKKWAAAAALGVSLFYTLLADSGSPTERSFIMISVMFIAIMLDRPAISLRNLAISAVIVLLITPEESLGASFQMSYLAVLGIAAFNAWHRNHRVALRQNMSWAERAFAKIQDMIVTSIGVSLVAGGATTIAAAYHFGRLSPYGAFANGLSMPVSEALVMPPAMVAVALMPFHLEYYPLKVMEFGLWFTMMISDWVGTWPGANLMVARPHIGGIILMVVGLGILCVGLGRLRLAGWPLMALGLVLTTSGQKPLLLVEDRAANAAILNAQGEYVLATQANKFASSRWLQSNGEQVTVLDAAAKPGWDCSSGDCFTTALPLDVSYLREKSGNGVYCPPTDIIIADYPLHHQCRDAKLVVDRIDVWKNGAYAVYISGNRMRVETARAEQGNRPWAYDSRKGIRKQDVVGVASAATDSNMR